MTAAQVRVEQCDRDAAAAIYERLHGYGVSKTAGKAELILELLMDDNLVVQAFARHRLATAAAPGVPDGWVAVPREPTEAMVDAMADIVPAHGLAVVERWRAGIAAAPTPSITHQGGAAEMREAAARVVETKFLNPTHRDRDFATAIRALPLPAAEAPQGWRDTTRALLMCAASCQGGHSDAGAAAAELLGIAFPVTMDGLADAAARLGFDRDELWPWWKRMRDAAAEYAASAAPSTLREGEGA